MLNTGCVVLHDFVRKGSMVLGPRARQGCLQGGGWYGTARLPVFSLVKESFEPLMTGSLGVSQAPQQKCEAKEGKGIVMLLFGFRRSSWSSSSGWAGPPSCSGMVFPAREKCSGDQVSPFCRKTTTEI